MRKTKQQTKQQLDGAHVSHEMRISAMGTGLTLGALRRAIAEWPDDAKIKFAITQREATDKGGAWALLESVSYCRSENEVSLW